MGLKTEGVRIKKVSRRGGKMAEAGETGCVTIPAMSTNHKRRRLKPRIRRRAAPGTKPGTMNVAPDAPPTKIDVIAYDRDRLVEKSNITLKGLDDFMSQWPVVWVNVIGLGSADTLQGLATKFTIHPLAMEDIVNVHQRAKFDQYDANVYFVVRAPDASRDECTAQLSFIIGKNYVVTFQEGPSDCFEPMRNRLRNEKSVLRQETQADYLAYRLIDAVVDAYFPILERVGDRLDELDDRTAAGEGQSVFGDLHGVKRELLLLRRAVWPLRDALREMQVEETPFVCNQTQVYLRDCQDHAIQLIDLVEAYRDISSDIRDFYLSTMSNRMNEIMKTLTIIATIFIPMNFIAALYGMNFEGDSPWNMPELHWHLGYPFALTLMASFAGGMLIMFWRRGWIGGGSNVVKPLDPPKNGERR
jgi:magnesium transporter